MIKRRSFNHLCASPNKARVSVGGFLTSTALGLLLVAIPTLAGAVGTADGFVPIGTTTVPASQLGVYGNVSIGTSYTGIAAPTNGAIIQGNVTIGTNTPYGTPAYALTVNGGAYGLYAGGAYSLFSNGINVVGIYTGVSGPAIGTFNNNSFSLQTNETNRLTIDTSGNVGIGTTSPANTLDVAGTGIRIASGVPGTTTNNELYSNGTTLYWNGNAVSTGNGATGAQYQMAFFSAANTVSGDNGIITDATNDLLVTGYGQATYFNATTKTGYAIGGVNGLSFPTDLGQPGSSIAIGSSALASQPLTASNFTHGSAGDPPTGTYANTALGYQTLGAGGTGLGSAAIMNTAVGYQVMASNTTGANNTAAGFQALMSNTTGTFNVAIGPSALRSNTTGYSNVSVGGGLPHDTNSYGNTAVGISALPGYNGNSNTAVGSSSGGNYPGSANSLFGSFAGYFMSGSNNDTLIGEGAGQSVGTGSYDTYLGSSAGSGVSGNNNTILGNAVASAGGATGLTTGTSNILIGTSAAVDTPANNTSNFLNIGNVIFATGMTGTLAAPAGKVGIGTTVPGATLHVVNGSNVFKFNNGASSVTPNISVESTSGKDATLMAGTTGAGFVFDSSGVFNISGDAHANIAAGTSNGGTVFMTVLGGGNVGIGTSSPNAQLEVYSTNPAVIAIEGAGLNQLAFYDNVGNVHGGLEQNTSGANAMTLWSNYGGPLYFNTSNTTQMTITASGSVGIGSSSPAAKLDVEAGTAAYGVLGVTANATAGSYGVSGSENASSGANFGVYGYSHSNSGDGVYGYNDNYGIGVYGYSANSGVGVQGASASGSGFGGSFVNYGTGNGLYVANGITIAAGTAGVITNALYNVGGALYWNGTALAAAGASGTVNSGTQYQMAYYAANGTAVSGDASITTDAAGDINLGGTAALAIDMARGTAAGNNLTLQAGGGVALGTNKSGGNLILASGISTGTGSSQIQFTTYPGATSGTADNLALAAATLSASGTLAAGTVNTTLQGATATAGSSNLNGGNLILASGISTGTGTSNINFNVYPGVASATAQNSPTTAMTILGNGSVGIGTTSPGALLDVMQSAIGSNVFPVRLNNASSNPYSGVGINFNAGGVGLAQIIAQAPGSSNGYLDFVTSNAGTANTRVRIDNQGNVGIGTTSPAVTLDVGANGSGQSARFNGTVSMGYGAAVPSTNANIPLMMYGQYQAEAYIISGGAAYPAQLVLQNGSGVTGATLASDATTQNVELDASAGHILLNPATGKYVGIGTSSPAYTLDVNGAINAGPAFSGGITGQINASGGNILAARNSSWEGFYIGLNSGGTNITASGSGAYADLNFFSNPSQAYDYTAGATRTMTIKSNGNVLIPVGSVAIGTTSPANTLDVAGTGIRIASGVPGTTTNNELYSSGTTLYWNGNAISSGGGTVDGGAQYQMAFFSAANTVSGDNGIITDATNDLLVTGYGQATYFNATTKTGYAIGGVNGLSFPTDLGQPGSSIAIGSSALASQPLTASNFTHGSAGDPPTGTYANTALGYQTLGAGGTGLGSAAIMNTAVGYQVMASNTTGANNTAAGFQALMSNTTGQNNTALGDVALSSNQTGGTNTAIGHYALRYAASGSSNTAVGDGVMGNTQGSDNTAVGQAALYGQTTGSHNSAFGFNAMYSYGSNLSGTYNTAVGDTSLNSVQTTASNNTALGGLAGNGIQTGVNNLVLGYNVASAGGATGLTTGSSNILIGTSNAVDTPANNTSNFLNIGNVIFAKGMTGSVTSPAGNVGIGTTNPMFSLDVHGNAAGDTVIANFQNTNATGASGFALADSSGTFQGAAGWENASSPLLPSTLVWGTLNTNPDVFITNTAERMRITGAGYVGIGTTAPAGALQVGAGTGQTGWTLNVTPSGGTAAQTAFFEDMTASTGVTQVLIQDGAGQNTTAPLVVENNLGGTMFSINGSTGYIQTSMGMISLSGNLSLLGAVNSGNGGNSVSIGDNGAVTLTSGTRNLLNVGTWNFDPASGTGVLNTIESGSVIAQTGTATGVSRGLYIGDTLTSAYDYRAIETAGNTDNLLGTPPTTLQQVLFNAPTLAATGSKTVTNAATEVITGAPIAGSSVSITNAYGLLIKNPISVGTGVTNAYGASISAPTGATNNYAAVFQGGDVGIGTASPQNLFQVGGFNYYGNLGTALAVSGNGTGFSVVSMGEAPDANLTSGGGLYIGIGNSGAKLEVGGDGNDIVFGTDSAGNAWINTVGAITTFSLGNISQKSGYVGIGSTSPLNTLDVTGTGIHLASGVPSTTTYDLYNSGGTLYWNGNAVNTGSSTSGAQYQMAYFSGLNTVGGDANITTDASNNLDILTGNINFGGSAAQAVSVGRGATVGNSLTVQAGGGVALGTNELGGNLILASGISTGTGSSQIQFTTYPGASSSGTSDNLALAAATLSASGTLAAGTVNTTLQGTSATVGSSNLNGGSLTLSSGVSTGTGTSGINFKVYPGVATGTTQNSPTTAMAITGAGNITIGTNVTWNNTSMLLAVGTGAATPVATTGTVAGSVMNVIPQASTNTGTGGANTTINGAATGQMAYYSGANAISGTPDLYVSGTNIGIGTTGPLAALDVAGSIYSRSVNNGAGTSISFTGGNVQYTSAACGAFTLSNMQDGGSYSLVVTGSGAGPASFAYSGLTVKAGGTSLTCTAATTTIFSFIRAGSYIYVAAVTGY